MDSLCGHRSLLAQGQADEFRQAPSPVFFSQGAGYARLRPVAAALEKEPRVRGTLRVQTDPRASTPRDVEACRVPNCRKSAQSQSVPRAVFIGLLRSAPGGLPFQATLLSLSGLSGRLTTARGPRGGRAGTSAAWTAGPARRISSRAVIPRPPLPASCQKMLIRHPSVTRQDAVMSHASVAGICS